MPVLQYSPLRHEKVNIVEVSDGVIGLSEEETLLYHQLLVASSCLHHYKMINKLSVSETQSRNFYTFNLSPFLIP